MFIIRPNTYLLKHVKDYTLAFSKLEISVFKKQLYNHLFVGTSIWPDDGHLGSKIVTINCTIKVVLTGFYFFHNRIITVCLSVRTLIKSVTILGDILYNSG
jgi:hypothetical protein